MRKVVPTKEWVLTHIKAVVVRAELGPCWEWNLACDHNGYGVWGTTRRNGERLVRRQVRAHRLSWELYNGPIPAGRCVLHKCDNTRCVNPEHLFLGTHADNARDKVEKGRLPNQDGVKNPSAVLTPDIVRALRRRWSTESRVVLCAEFGVNYFTARMAVTGKTWASIHDVPPVACRPLLRGRPAPEPKQRQVGEAHHGAKLTEEKVKELRRRWKNEPTSELEKEFGLSHNAAWCAATGRTWKHIPL